MLKPYDELSEDERLLFTKIKAITINGEKMMNPYWSNSQALANLEG